MKILFICAFGSIHAQRWVRYFNDAGNEVHVLVIDKAFEIKIEGVKTHYIPVEGIKFPLLDYLTRYKMFLAKLKIFLNELKPDIVHIHQVNYHAFAFSRCNYHPFVLTAWGSDILIRPKKSLRFRYIAKKVIKNADIITCDANHMKKALINLGADSNRIKIIYFGTDLTIFNPENKDINIKRELGFKDNTPLVISLRVLDPIYNVSTFINCIPQVLEKHKEARFIVVGSGSESEMLRKLAEELGVSDYVIFTGRVSDEDLIRYTASADIYVSTSLSDAGLSASTAEAMACKVPVIITDFGDNHHWVKDGERGLLFPMKDNKKLSEKVNYLLDNPKTASKLGKAAYVFIKENNNWHREMEKMSGIYKEIISK